MGAAILARYARRRTPRARYANHTARTARVQALRESEPALLALARLEDEGQETVIQRDEALHELEHLRATKPKPLPPDRSFHASGSAALDRHHAAVRQHIDSDVTVRRTRTLDLDSPKESLAGSVIEDPGREIGTRLKRRV